jgi:hypothetical protein
VPYRVTKIGIVTAFCSRPIEHDLAALAPAHDVEAFEEFFRWQEVGMTLRTSSPLFSIAIILCQVSNISRP